MSIIPKSNRRVVIDDGNIASEDIIATRTGFPGKRKRKALVSLAVVSMLMLMSTAVMISSSSNEAIPEKAKTSATTDPYVQMGMLSSVIYWNPLNVQMVEDYVVTYLVYSSLFTYDQDWEGPVYDLATGYWQEVHANGSMTTYINVTTNAYFRSIDNVDDVSNPLDARDVAYTYNLIKNNSGGTFDWYLEELSYFTALESVPGSGVWDRVSTWCSYQKATILDDISSVPILPMYIWGPDGENYEDRALSGMDPEEQIGSGPFVFEDWERDSWYMFKTAPNYHGEADYGAARTVSIPGVLYNVVSDTVAMCIQINSGALDCGVLTGALPPFLDILGKDASVNVYKAAVTENGITDIAINAIPDVFDVPNYLDRHPALLDPFVRKAIHMTLNKDYIVEVILAGLAVKASSVIQPGFWQADIQNKVEYDPAGAKAMLEDNGWADSDGDGWLEATATAYGVQMGWFPVGTELSGIRCQAVDTDANYGMIAAAWPMWADDAGIQLIGSIESETTMVNEAWYSANFDIWVWHWGWGPEPIGGALSVWLTSEIEKAGDNCEMPMGPWWTHKDNITVCPYVDQDMIDKYDIMNADTWDGRFSAYDQNITDAMRILDPDERKVILDKLQQWIYDSNTELIPYYDLGLYGYTDNHFDNWGDWEAHNGLSVSQGLPWLWFMLEPVVDRKPLFNVPPETMYIACEGVAEWFSVAVSDDEGSPLYVNFTFGDGDVESAYLTGDTTMAQWVNVSHTYAAVGTYTLNVSLTDGFKEDDVVRNLYREATVEVLGELNEPAVITSVTRDPPSPAYVDQVVTWTATAVDPDSGTKVTGLKFTWDWGDGTYSVERTATVPDGTPVTSTQTHSWSDPYEYNVTVSVFDEYGSEDGEHNVSVMVPYTIILNQPPAAPAVAPITGLVDIPVTCTAMSSDPDLEDLRFTWGWGDGTFDVEILTPAFAGQALTSVVEHLWSAEGLYNVTVWVGDESGHNVSTAVLAEIMSNNMPPIADFTVTPELGYVGTVFTVDASSSYDMQDPVEALEVRWDWNNDGVWDTEWTTDKVAYHQILVAGEYILTLEVRDSDGMTDTEPRVVKVFDSSFEQGEFPERLFTIVKPSEIQGRAEYVSTMNPQDDFDWWLELTHIDGSWVKIGIYEEEISSTRLLSDSKVAIVGDESEHVALRADTVYWIVIQCLGREGGAELTEHAVPTATTLSHDPILIEGDDDFSYENGVVQGDGTYENPYVIDGWMIEADTANGIEIRNTDAHFVIRDVEIVNGLGGNFSGIKLYRTTNGSIDDCGLGGNLYGILVEFSSGLTIIDNHVASCLFGVVVGLSDSIDIHRNEIISCALLGIHVNSTGRFGIVNNSVSDTGDLGISVGFCRYGTIAGNVVAYSGGCGITLRHMNEQISLFKNNMWYNSVQAFDDNVGMNSWDEGYPWGGNFWSDYTGVDMYSGPDQDILGSDGIGDTPYTIGVFDRYPLMAPVG